MKRNKKYKQTDNTKSNKNTLKVYLLFLAIVPLVLYFRVYNFNFVNFDDVNMITDNYNSIGNLENVPKAFVTDAYFSHQSNFYRPLQTISFMIDSQISELNPIAYHITNLILHILIVIILFILLNKLEIRQEIAFVLSLLYAVHPLVTSAVCWIPARGDLFLTLFGLLSFVTFINYFSNKNIKNLIIHSICFLLSFFSKETALVLPLLLATYLYFVLKKERFWKELLPFLITWCLSFLFYFFLRNIAITSYKSSSLSGIIPFVKNLPAIPITFGKIFLPFNLSTMPLFDNLSIILGVMILIIFIVIIAKYQIYKNPYIIFGALWFIGFSLPPLYVRSLSAEIVAEYYEHRTLLPMIGIFIMVGIFLNTLLKKWSSSGIIKLFIPIIIFIAFIAYFHSSDYSEPITFFSSAIASNSNNATAFNSRGVEYLQNGNLQKSIADYENAIKSCPNLSSPYYNAGGIFHSSGDEIKAEYYYSQALKVDTLYRNINNLGIKSYYNLSIIKIKLKKYDEAIALLKKVLYDSNTSSDLYNDLGYVYYTIAKFDSAIFAFTHAIELNPNSTLYYTNRGLSRFSIKDYKGALSDYSKVLTLDPNSAGCWYNAGTTKIGLNDFEGAISDLSMAIKINPKWGEAYFHRGIAYSKLNKISEASKDWALAKKLGSKEMIDGK